MPKNVETMTCGVCENNAFFLCNDGLIHCDECHTLLLGIKWIEEDE